MITLRWLLIVGCAYLIVGPLLDRKVWAQGLEVSLRLHTGTVTYGDPLYVEVTITNRGNEIAQGLAPSAYGGTLGFRFQDPERDLISVSGSAAGMVGGVSMMVFAPGESAKSHKYIFLPSSWGVESPFWEPFQKQGRKLEIIAVYRPHPHVALLSKRHEILIEPRKKRELQVLRQIRDAEIRTYERGPNVNDFGVAFLRPLPRVWTHAVATELRSGELKDLLELAVMLADLYALPVDSRERGNRELVEWLRIQPEVKREALVEKTRVVAAANNMLSTVDAIVTELPIE